MALAKRSAAYGDKKHDGEDGPIYGQSWQPNTRMRSWTTFRKRRVLFAIVVIGLLYLFFKNMPTDVPPAGSRIDPLTGLSRGRRPLPLHPNSQQDGPDTREGKGPYDGPVKFYNLASTLRFHLHQNLDGKENVVFVLHDLRSAASLASLACEIGLQNRTSVHMVLVCPHENTINEIVEVTGIKQQNCPIFWHDARPDHNPHSSLARRMTTIQVAMGHVQSYLKPVTVMIDEQQAKDTHFTTALRSRLDLSWTPLTIVPNDAPTSMKWITTLDARGLSLINQIQIDIIISPYRSSSASLMRLLQSIESASYAGLPLPHITVEIPPEVDSFALNYLEYFRWPYDVPSSPSKLTLRRRLDTSILSPALASLRTLESFYPPSYPMSHVLLLDPDVVLSPDYLSYLHYLTLDYKYGMKGQNISNALMGISLDVTSSPSPETSKATPLILSQSATSTATLYFGDRWVELQNYLSLRLEHDPTLTTQVQVQVQGETKDKPNPPADRPSWLTIATELMRARNYYALHPTDKRLITIHTESHQPPEDFPLPKPALSRSKDPNDTTIPKPDTDIPSILTSENLYTPPSRHHAVPDLTSSFVSSLLGTGRDPQHAGLPVDRDIPMYNHDGAQVDWIDSTVTAERYAEQVSLQVGGCKSLAERDMTGDEIERMFCKLDGSGG